MAVKIVYGSDIRGKSASVFNDDGVEIDDVISAEVIGGGNEERLAVITVVVSSETNFYDEDGK